MSHLAVLQTSATQTKLECLYHAQHSMSSSSTPLQPLRIEIGGTDSHAFKSITNLIWEDIPPLAVLTGLNGSGKTQLLELLAYKLANTPHPEVGDFDQVKLKIDGDDFGPESIAYLPSWWTIANFGPISIGQMQEAKQQLYQQLVQPHGNDLASQRKRARLAQLLGVSNLREIKQEDFIKRLPDDFMFMLDETDVTAGLVHVFLAYRLQAAEQLERGTKKAEIPSKIGPPPWEVVNETFQAAGFPYRVISPMQSGFLSFYELLLKDPASGKELRPQDLSSGEKTLLALVLWLYNSKHHAQFPRLFLLDEPDAYLHPSLTRQFLNVIQEVLVERYGVRVILVTHSPSTVALAPDQSVFEMTRGAVRILHSPSKAHSIGLLTAGLVMVSASTRYVLVEDSDDVDFYNSLRDIFTDYGPSRDPRSIKPSPSIAFLPVSVGTGKAKVGGGKDVVTQWVNKFDQPPLNEIFRGIIDRDGGNASTPRIEVLGRYSIENYLCDPFVVFGLLVEQGRAPSIAAVNISQGDEHRIRELSESQLQEVARSITSAVEPSLPNLTTAEQLLKEVEFTSGKRIQYPAWLIDRRGHDLLPIFQSVFGGPKVLSPPRLSNSLRRVRLVPKELADIFDNLQR